MPAALARRVTMPQDDPRRRPWEPEWDRVAEMSAVHLANEDQAKRIRKTIADLRGEILHVAQAVERCEEVVGVAAREEPRRLSAEALGETYEGAAPPLGVAEQNLQRAQGDLKHKHKVVEALEKDLVAALERQSQSRAQLRVAVNEVLAAYVLPAVESVYDQGRAQTECGADILRALGPLRLPAKLARWDVSNRPVPPVPPVATMVKAAIEKLESGAVAEGRRALDAAMVALPTVD